MKSPKFIQCNASATRSVKFKIKMLNLVMESLIRSLSRSVISGNMFHYNNRPYKYPDNFLC